MELNEIINDAFLLHDKVCQSSIYIQLKQVEEEMFQNEQLSSIFLRYQEIQKQYVEVNDSQLLKQLYELKIIIDQHEIVKEYKKFFKAFAKEVNEIKNIIFEDLIKDDILLDFKV